MPVLCFNRLPHPRRWDALSGEGINVQPACCFDCRNSVVIELLAGTAGGSNSEMDDKLVRDPSKRRVACLYGSYVCV